MRHDHSAFPLIDFAKALASQLIVWHHLAAYGPMSDVAYPAAGEILDWLYGEARMVVAMFIVIGGFLAARSLAPSLDAAAMQSASLDPLTALRRRYLRLMRPYVVALLLAVACAAMARRLIAHPTIPDAPSLAEFVAHLLLLHDIVDVDALSAGVWYVAIDFQLFAMLLLLSWLARRLAGFRGWTPGDILAASCFVITGASLLWLNRIEELDAWAPYFFGAYGLGAMAYWISARAMSSRWLPWIGLTVLVALALGWRERVLIAAAMATMLTATGFFRRLPVWRRQSSISALSAISYEVFLIHYPVCLLVGAAVHRLAPNAVAVNVLGMIVAWLLSVAAGAGLHRLLESMPGQRIPAR